MAPEGYRCGQECSSRESRSIQVADINDKAEFLLEVVPEDSNQHLKNRLVPIPSHPFGIKITDLTWESEFCMPPSHLSSYSTAWKTWLFKLKVIKAFLHQWFSNFRLNQQAVGHSPFKN